MIFRIFSIMNSETLSSLQEFVNIFRENIAAIRAFKVPDLSGFLLFYIAFRVLSTIQQNVCSKQKTKV